MRFEPAATAAASLRRTRTRLTTLAACTAIATLGVTALSAQHDRALASAANPLIYVDNDGAVQMYDTAAGAVTATIPTSSGGTIQDIAVSPDGGTLYATEMGTEDVGPEYGLLAVIDTATDSVTATVRVGFFPIGVVVSPDGTAVYVANTGSGTVSVISTATGAVTGTLGTFDNPLAVAVPPGPEVDLVTPHVGVAAGGNTVTISGSSFDDVTGVDLGGVPATSFTVNGDTSITATVPPGTAGRTIDITVQAAAGVSTVNSADQYSYVNPIRIIPPPIRVPIIPPVHPPGLPV